MSDALQRSEDILELIKSGKVSQEDGQQLFKRLIQSLDSQGKESLDSQGEEGNNKKDISNSKVSFASPITDHKSIGGVISPYGDDDDHLFVDASSHHQGRAISPMQSKQSLSVESSLVNELAGIKSMLSQHSMLLAKLHGGDTSFTSLPSSIDPPSKPSESTSTNSHTMTTSNTNIVSIPSIPVLPRRRTGGEVASTTTTTFTTKNTSILEQQNAHEYDRLIEPDNACGNYHVQVIMESIANLIRSYCKQFNADEAITSMIQSPSYGSNSKYFTMTSEGIKAQWEKTGQEAMALSDDMHKAIFLFYNNDIEFEQVKSIEITRNFINFHDEIIFKNKFKPYRSYWHIFDAESRIATTIPMVFRSNPLNSDQLIMVDFRRVKELKISNSRGIYMFKPLEYLPDTNFIHYSLELNLGRYILEKNYGKIVDKMYVVLLHPELKTYGLKEITRMDKEVQEMLVSRIIRPPVVPKNLALSTVVESPMSNTSSRPAGGFFGFA